MYPRKTEALPNRERLAHFVLFFFDILFLYTIGYFWISSIKTFRIYHCLGLLLA